MSAQADPVREPWFERMTSEERAYWFRYCTPEEFLAWKARQCLPDKCEDPATLSRVAKIAASPPQAA